jgi:hypothetical protein
LTSDFLVVFVQYVEHRVPTLFHSPVMSLPMCTSDPTLQPPLAFVLIPRGSIPQGSVQALRIGSVLQPVLAKTKAAHSPVAVVGDCWPPPAPSPSASASSVAMGSGNKVWRMISFTMSPKPFRSLSSLRYVHPKMCCKCRRKRYRNQRNSGSPGFLQVLGGSSCCNIQCLFKKPTTRSTFLSVAPCSIAQE